MRNSSVPLHRLQLQSVLQGEAWGDIAHKSLENRTTLTQLFWVGSNAYVECTLQSTRDSENHTVVCAVYRGHNTAVALSSLARVAFFFAPFEAMYWATFARVDIASHAWLLALPVAGGRRRFGARHDLGGARRVVGWCARTAPRSEHTVR